ncbi:hypothetical protein J7438_22075 [Thalassotalea sp. G20_0]|uniref:hypothetical protein n=1 Tax=Thalassotalea sp. G20_0 TaxID=2821093 RepID=UPI001ADCA1C5|nr:hypothetical protein [Thalassotalea sp. G20_0]MBO9496751.1 hypothetical protein [Thalassotalea sp. G20_0]
MHKIIKLNMLSFVQVKLNLYHLAPNQPFVFFLRDNTVGLRSGKLNILNSALLGFVCYSFGIPINTG